jgi:hypothetical protein
VQNSQPGALSTYFIDFREAAEFARANPRSTLKRHGLTPGWNVLTTQDGPVATKKEPPNPESPSLAGAKAAEDQGQIRPDPFDAGLFVADLDDPYEDDFEEFDYFADEQLAWSESVSDTWRFTRSESDGWFYSEEADELDWLRQRGFSLIRPAQ